MEQQTQHPVLPDTTHDEQARQEFVQSLKLHLATKVVAGNREVYERRVQPAFENNHGRPPATRLEVAAEMHREPFHQLWGSLQRVSQEMCWSSALESIERQRTKLIERSRSPEQPLGSLTLDPGVAIPRYLSAVDIHCMPGGYSTERVPDDPTAGALYDRGA